MADPPPRGQVRLYPSIRPALGAGRYAVDLEQTIAAGGPIDPVTRYVEVTGPRFLLPATELHSVYPPPNSEGDYSLRLPQIAFKRRTLPWERESNGQTVDVRPSWLALIVLAEGEGTFLANVAIADALPAEVRSALGVTETGTCDVLEVSRTVVDQVFPREDELPLLCHVRETNLQDTELAGSDDDGFVSVVISNRLPQPGHQYGAYLVSLEGRFAELPDPRPPQDEIGPALVYPFAEQAGLLEAVSFERTGRELDRSHLLGTARVAERRTRGRGAARSLGERHRGRSGRRSSRRRPPAALRHGLHRARRRPGRARGPHRRRRRPAPALPRPGALELHVHRRG